MPLLSELDGSEAPVVELSQGAKGTEAQAGHLGRALFVVAQVMVVPDLAKLLHGQSRAPEPASSPTQAARMCAGACPSCATAAGSVLPAAEAHLIGARRAGIRVRCRCPPWSRAQRCSEARVPRARGRACRLGVGRGGRRERP